MAVFNIRVYLDTSCPWCYIGHRSLDRAIDLYKRTYPGGSQAKFDFFFCTFYLDPDAPREGVPMLEKMAAKNGAERVDAIRTRLERVGREYGILFNFEGRTGNTRDSHRLIRIAGREKQKEVVERLFESHFEQGGDITSKDLLLGIAKAVDLGHDDKVLNLILSSNAVSGVVDGMARQARESGVTSVPTIEINGVRLEGALEPSEYYQIFVEASKSIDA